MTKVITQRGKKARHVRQHGVQETVTPIQAATTDSYLFTTMLVSNESYPVFSSLARVTNEDAEIPLPRSPRDE